MLTGTKLTGNQFVRAGRATWTISATSCHVVSSLWAGVYTPRWEACRVDVIDGDHMQAGARARCSSHHFNAARDPRIESLRM